MRLLHISDLHIGKKVNEFPMLEDQKHILRQILEIADNQRADGVMIAGDIYDGEFSSISSVCFNTWRMVAGFIKGSRYRYNSP